MQTKKKIIIISILLLLIGAIGAFVYGSFGGGVSGPSAAPNLAEYGLVGYWNMEEGTGQTVYDRSGNANNGTFGGTTAVQKSDPVFTSGYSSSGPGGTALKFDGKDDYVDAGSNSSLDNLGPLTWSAWIYPRSVGEGSAGRIFDKAQKRLFLENDTSRNIAFGVSGVGLLYRSTANNVFNLNTWSYVTVTWDGANDQTKIHIYVNGVECSYSSGANGSTPNDDSASNFIIGNVVGTTATFDGLIDEPRVYNRALSADEIRQLYNQKKPILEWKFDEGSGTTIKDESFNNNDITLVNTPSWLQGKFGSALNFTKTSSQYGYLADNASISLTKDLTISAWVKPSSTTAATLFDIAGKWDGANESYLLAQYGDEIRMYINSSSNYKTTNAADLQTGQWYHIEGAYNAAAQTVNVYVNGILQTGTVTGTIPASIGDDTGRFHIGAEDSTTTAANFYDGAIDEAKVYSYARTSDEVRTDYNSGKAAHLGKDSQRDDGLVGYWNMEEGAGQTVYDRSGNGNNGTLGASASVAKDDPVFASGYSSAGAGGTALKFDGKDDYVWVANNASLQFTDNLTLCSWHYDPGAAHGAIMGKVGGTWTYMLAVEHGSQQFYLRLNNTIFNYQASIPGGLDIYHNKWVNLCATYDKSNVRLYINGELKSTIVFTNSITTSSDNFAIGARGNAITLFNSLIDEVRVYNRALSADEIRQLYNQKKPILEMKFDEGSGQVAYDGSFNNNDGTLGSTSGSDANDPTWTAGKFGSALSFDGTDDYVDLGQRASLRNSGDITLSAWVKLNSDYTTAQAIIADAETSSACDYAFTFGFTDNKYEFWQNANGPNITSTATISDNNFRHIVVTRSGSTNNWTLKIYINGVLDKSVTTVINPSTMTTSQQTIGRFGGYQLAYKMKGIIDEPRIYNYARAQDEILVDYNSGKAVHLGKDSQRDDGLVGYWNMEEGTGQTISDRSGNGNNGTLGANSSVGKDDPVFTGGYSSSGPGGTGLKFDGVDDYILTSLDVPPSSFTLSAMINSNYTTSADNIRGIFEKKNVAGEWWLYQTDTKKLTFQARDSAVVATKVIAGNTVLTNGIWYHIVVTYDGTTAILYINGNVDNSSSAGNPIRDTASIVRIGTDSLDADRYFNGVIDESRIYNRALSADEIRQLYNQKKPILEMKFDEGSGQIAYDGSFNNNDGTLGDGTCVAGAGTCPSWTAGKFGSALSFDGTDDYVDTSTINFVGTQFTFTFWMYMTSASNSGIPLSWSSNRWCRIGGLTANKINCSVDSSSAGSAVSTTSVNNGNWYFISYQVIGDAQKIFVNGIQEGTATETLYTGNGIVRMGNVPVSGYSWAGKLDDVRVYNYARTQDEILADYNNGLAAHLR